MYGRYDLVRIRASYDLGQIENGNQVANPENLRTIETNLAFLENEKVPGVLELRARLAAIIASLPSKAAVAGTD